MGSRLPMGLHAGPPMHEPKECPPTVDQSCVAWIDTDYGIVLRDCHSVKCQNSSFVTFGAGKGLACVQFDMYVHIVIFLMMIEMENSRLKYFDSIINIIEKYLSTIS